MQKPFQQDSTPKFYFYKMTVDEGGAPCVQDGLLTLAICKPTIRRVAPEGSVIIAFAGDCMSSDGYEDNSIGYAAVASRRVAGGEYYSEKRYANTRVRRIVRTRGRFGPPEFQQGHNLFPGPSVLRTAQGGEIRPPNEPSSRKADGGCILTPLGKRK